jgi:hypothetical protein
MRALMLLPMLAGLLLSGCLGALEQTCSASNLCDPGQHCEAGLCVCDEDTLDVNGDPSDACEHRCYARLVEGHALTNLAAGDSLLASSVSRNAAAFITQNSAGTHTFFWNGQSVVNVPGGYDDIVISRLDDDSLFVLAHTAALDIGMNRLGATRAWLVRGGEIIELPFSNGVAGAREWRRGGLSGLLTIEQLADMPVVAMLPADARSIELYALVGGTMTLFATIDDDTRFNPRQRPHLMINDGITYVIALAINGDLVGYAVGRGSATINQAALRIAPPGGQTIRSLRTSPMAVGIANIEGGRAQVFVPSASDGLVFQTLDTGTGQTEADYHPVLLPAGFAFIGQNDVQSGHVTTVLTGLDNEYTVADIFPKVSHLKTSTSLAGTGEDVELLPAWALWLTDSGALMTAQIPCN